ncbi:unannotated protein [freshwater metagenome]|uniref:Unannotated protein n=1 Tax=freshwater metagenome TaxID=449393 RepID=A0A6J6VHL3_9ZZZZ
MNNSAFLGAKRCDTAQIWAQSRLHWAVFARVDRSIGKPSSLVDDGLLTVPDQFAFPFLGAWKASSEENECPGNFSPWARSP